MLVSLEVDQPPRNATDNNTDVGSVIALDRLAQWKLWRLGTVPPTGKDYCCVRQRTVSDQATANLCNGPVLAIDPIAPVEMP